jgi:dTDP-4-dehydrorhamnose 3,5-epimerase
MKLRIFVPLLIVSYLGISADALAGIRGAVDLGRSSPHFGIWVGVELSADNKRQMRIPEGFGHGFLVLSDFADFRHKTTEYWIKEHDLTVRWDDPAIGVRWPLTGEPVHAVKDICAPRLSEAEVFD